LTAVIYLCFAGLKNSIEYVSLDNHIYNYTLYNKSYIKLSKKVRKTVKNIQKTQEI
jgi:hypothetical protein